LGAVASSARGEQKPFLYPPVMRHLAKELPVQDHRGIVSSTVTIGVTFHGMCRSSAKLVDVGSSRWVACSE